MTITVNSRTIAITVVAALAILAAYLIGSARPSVAGAATQEVGAGAAHLLIARTDEERRADRGAVPVEILAQRSPHRGRHEDRP